MVAPPRRFDVWLVNLDPTVDAEIRKTRPCLVISPDELNRHIRTVIVAPMTSAQRNYPSRIDVVFQRMAGQVVLDQIRTVDRSRLVSRLGRISEPSAREIADLLVQMFSYD